MANAALNPSGSSQAMRLPGWGRAISSRPGRKLPAVAGQDPAASAGREILIGLTRLAEPWAVRVAATLRLADLAADGGTRLEDLAARAGSDPPALGCLLRFLAARGVFEEPAPGVFAVNDAARWVQEEHPGRLRRWLDLDGAGGAMDRAYAGLLGTVRSGKAAYPVLSGHGLWEDLAADPRLAASFAALMQAHSAELADDVVAGYRWAEQSLVADVGGGTGALLARILGSHPHLRGILVDLMAGSPETAKVLSDAGVAGRCRPVVGDFFGPLPAGADVYLLRNILHDWPDDQAVAILSRCAQAAREDGRVLVVERVVTRDGDQRDLTGMDLRMLLLFGSRERRLEEFNALASAAGMQLVSNRATASSYWLLEYAAVRPA
jgi:SAM-dependent methyltransferase